MTGEFPLAYKRQVPRFMKELRALTKKYGIMVEAQGDDVCLDTYATGRCLARIRFCDDRYYLKEEPCNHRDGR